MNAEGVHAMKELADRAIQEAERYPLGDKTWPGKELHEKATLATAYLTLLQRHERLREAGDGPKRVTICGSSRFIELMAVCAWLIERDERAIVMSLHLLPGWYPDVAADHMAEAEGVADGMDRLHLRKIDLSQEIFVVNKDDYVGESTSKEIAYAKERGVPIRWYSRDPIGEKCESFLVKAIAAWDAVAGEEPR